jgi:hypothetical protein
MTDRRAAIIVTAYKRKRCLQLLLQSIASLVRPNLSNLEIDLFFMIDHSEMQEEIAQICEGFNWSFGEKQVILATQRQGLKSNVLAAFDVGEGFDFFIVLEDDLFLSPYALQYAYDAYDRFSKSQGCIGASLYSYELDEISLERFVPFTSGLDVFTASAPCSWGCVYWAKGLGTTLRTAQASLDEAVLPHNVRRWSPQSWKKLMYFHMIIADKFLIYPTLSLSTVTSSSGQHQNAGNMFSVPLASRAIKMPRDGAQLVHYDSYLEISPSSLRALNPALNGYEFVVNLKNQKPPVQGLSLVKTNRTDVELPAFDGSFTPPEFGVLEAVEGKGIALSRHGSNRRYGFEKLFRDLRRIFNLGYLRRLLRFGYR